jgi:hypothetical protein
VDNGSDVKGSKALAAVGSEEEHIANDKSLRVSAAKKADKRTDACNRTYDFRPARPGGGDSLNLILEWLFTRTEYLCDPRTRRVCDTVLQVSGTLQGG